MSEKSLPTTFTLSKLFIDSYSCLASANSWLLILENAFINLSLDELPSPILAIKSIDAETPAQAA